MICIVIKISRESILYKEVPSAWQTDYGHFLVGSKKDLKIVPYLDW